MKTLYILLGTLLIAGLLTTDGLAQRSAKRSTDYDAIMTYRLGWQGIGLGEINQALQQAGYSVLPSQVRVVSIASQISRPDRRLAVHSEIGISLGSAVTNGTFKAQSGFSLLKFGGSYRVIGTDKFQLAPQLSLVLMPYHLQVSPVNNTIPSLTTALTNPGSAQTTTLRTSTGGIDAGLTATLRIPRGQRQIDCSIIERSFVIGFDAGYRLAARAHLVSREINATNPDVQLSGWYAGLRLGFGTRVRSTASPVTY